MLPPSFLSVRRLVKAFWRYNWRAAVSSWNTTVIVLIFTLASAPFFLPLGRSQTFRDWLLGTIGADVYQFLSLFVVFLVGRWAWSVAWLIPVTGFAAAQFRSKRRAACLRVGKVAHRLPLTEFSSRGGTIIKIKVTVVSAELLVTADAQGTSDPYVTIECGAKNEDIRKHKKGFFGELGEGLGGFAEGVGTGLGKLGKKQHVVEVGEEEDEDTKMAKLDKTKVSEKVISTSEECLRSKAIFPS